VPAGAEAKRGAIGGGEEGGEEGGEGEVLT